MVYRNGKNYKMIKKYSKNTVSAFMSMSTEYIIEKYDNEKRFWFCYEFNLTLKEVTESMKTKDKRSFRVVKITKKVIKV